MELLWHTGHSLVIGTVILIFCIHPTAASGRNVAAEHTGYGANRRFLNEHFTSSHKGNWSEQETACMTTCVEAYKQDTYQCCVQLDCIRLPVQDLIPFIGQCPADGMWLKWGEWSHCSSTCGSAGSRTRHRACYYPQHLSQGAFCMGHGAEMDKCRAHNC